MGKCQLSLCWQVSWRLHEGPGSGGPNGSSGHNCLVGPPLMWGSSSVTNSHQGPPGSPVNFYHTAAQVSKAMQARAEGSRLHLGSIVRRLYTPPVPAASPHTHTCTNSCFLSQHLYICLHVAQYVVHVPHVYMCGSSYTHTCKCLCTYNIHRVFLTLTPPWSFDGACYV